MRTINVGITVASLLIAVVVTSCEDRDHPFDPASTGYRPLMASFDIADNVLYAKSEHGDILWGETFDGPISKVKLTNIVGNQDPEIIIATSTSEGSPPRVSAYDVEKKLLWTKAVVEEDNYGRGVDFSVTFMEVDDLNGDATKEVVLISHHHLWFSSRLLVLQAETGEFISEYWHPGHLQWQYTILEDINSDGITEVLCGARNNDIDSDVLILINPFTIHGEAFPYHGKSDKGNPLKYLVPTDICPELDRSRRNFTDMKIVSSDEGDQRLIRVNLMDERIFFFTFDFQIHHIGIGEGFPEMSCGGLQYPDLSVSACWLDGTEKMEMNNDTLFYGAAICPQ